jgi:hypothetical protein
MSIPPQQPGMKKVVFCSDLVKMTDQEAVDWYLSSMTPTQRIVQAAKDIVHEELQRIDMTLLDLAWIGEGFRIDLTHGGGAVMAVFFDDEDLRIWWDRPWEGPKRAQPTNHEIMKLARRTIRKYEYANPSFPLPFIEDLKEHLEVCRRYGTPQIKNRHQQTSRSVHHAGL